MTKVPVRVLGSFLSLLNFNRNLRIPHRNTVTVSRPCLSNFRKWRQNMRTSLRKTFCKVIRNERTAHIFPFLSDHCKTTTGFETTGITRATKPVRGANTNVAPPKQRVKCVSHSNDRIAFLTTLANGIFPSTVVKTIGVFTLVTRRQNFDACVKKSVIGLDR